MVTLYFAKVKGRKEDKQLYEWSEQCELVDSYYYRSGSIEHKNKLHKFGIHKRRLNDKYEKPVITKSKQHSRKLIIDQIQSEIDSYARRTNVNQRLLNDIKESRL